MDPGKIGKDEESLLQQEAIISCLSEGLILSDGSIIKKGFMSQL